MANGNDINPFGLAMLAVFLVAWMAAAVAWFYGAFHLVKFYFHWWRGRRHPEERTEYVAMTGLPLYSANLTPKARHHLRRMIRAAALFIGSVLAGAAVGVLAELFGPWH